MNVNIYTKNGWLTRTSQFSSDFELAKPFTLTEAITTCARFKANGVIAVPVRQDDVEYLT